MANVIVVTCPECEKQVKVRAESEGKKVRCTGCEHVFVARTAAPAKKAAPAAAKPKAKKDEALDVVPVKEESKPAAKAKPAKPAKPAAPAKPKYDDEDEEGGNPYGLETVDLTPRCPICTHRLEEEGQVICLNCGYNLQTREKTPVKRMYANTAGDWILWLTPGILSVLAILLMIAFDIWFWLPTGFDSAVAGLLDGWIAFLFSGGFSKKIWPTIITLFLMYYAGRFAIGRLIFNPRPPERLKKGGNA
jgi:predicted Zn finger-like uncharacterized protein